MQNLQNGTAMNTYLVHFTGGNRHGAVEIIHCTAAHTRSAAWAQTLLDLDSPEITFYDFLDVQQIAA